MNIVGIDFGTTKSLAAFVNSSTKQVQTIRLGRAGDEIPTTIHVDAKRQFLYGDDADDMLSLEPQGYLRRMKRFFGTKRDIILSGHSFHPVEIGTEYLRHIKHRLEAEQFYGKIDHAVLTVPAKFGPAARCDVELAAKAAGFSHIEVLEEPIAAGIAFLDEKKESTLGDQILVFDWGGGTLDIALVESQNGELRLNLEILEGDAELGGEDIDDSLLAAVNATLKTNGQPFISRECLADYRSVHDKIITLKKMLSKKESHSFHHRSLNYNFQFSCSRSNFDYFIKEELNKAFLCFSRWENLARSAGKIAQNVLLVGGTSQIPAIAKYLEKWGKTPLIWTRSQQAVALGAALHGERLFAGRAEQASSSSSQNTASQTASKESFADYDELLQSLQGKELSNNAWMSIIAMRYRLNLKLDDANQREIVCWGTSLESLCIPKNGENRSMNIAVTPEEERQGKKRITISKSGSLPERNIDLHLSSGWKTETLCCKGLGEEGLYGGSTGNLLIRCYPVPPLPTC